MEFFEWYFGFKENNPFSGKLAMTEVAKLKLWSRNFSLEKLHWLSDILPDFYKFKSLMLLMDINAKQLPG